MKFLNKVLVLLMLSAAFVVGCSDDDDVAVTGITLNKTGLTLEVGQTEQLTATVTPDNATNKTVTWTSKDLSIATVDANGNVTAVANGSTDIVAKAGDKEAKCTVTVTPDDYADVIAGDYTGTIAVSPLSLTIPDATINVTYKAKNKVTLKLNQELMPGVAVNIEGDFDVVKSGDDYKIDGDIASFKLNGNTIPSPVSVDGTFPGDGETHIDIELTVPGAGALTVTFDGAIQ